MKKCCVVRSFELLNNIFFHLGHLIGDKNYVVIVGRRFDDDQLGM